jgi:hypothetical protein
VRSLANPPASVERGGSFTSALRVVNLGARAARRSTVRGYLSRDSRKSSGDIPLQPARRVPRLKPGKVTRRSTVIVRVPRATSTGPWFLIACADAARIVRETNERNNCRTSARRTAVTAEGSAPSPPPPPPGGEPAPIAGQAYTLRFDDQFNTLNRAVWDDHIWYEGAPAANAQYLQSGVFHLVARRSQGFQKTTATTLRSRSFMLGYFEARMRWTAGPGAWPAFWLLSTGWANTGSCTTPAAELDVFEGQGTEPNVFYGTIHRHSAGGSCGGNQMNGNNWQPQSLNLTTGFHTYAMLWTATQVCWYVDNVQSHCAPTFSTTNQPMFLMLQMWIGGWTSGTNSSTPDELHTEVDWVRVWQK